MRQGRKKGILIGILLLAALVVGARQIRFQSVDSYRAQQEQAQREVEAETGAPVTPAASGDAQEDGGIQIDAEPAASDGGEKTEAGKRGARKKTDETAAPENAQKKSRSRGNRASGKSDGAGTAGGHDTAGGKAGKHPHPSRRPSSRATGKPGASADSAAPAQQTEAAENGGAAQTAKPSDSSGGDSAPVHVATAKPTAQPTAEILTCTIEIRCDRLTEKKKTVAQNLWKYIPDSGTILQKSSVTVAKGASVYDVLEKACKANGIAVDAEYTPLYKSYYVRGIAQLYEKQAGDMSGWIYQVNGTSPNRGASAYKVSAGDVISWRYTCDGKTS